jgi:hypothetical protein
MSETHFWSCDFCGKRLPDPQDGYLFEYRLTNLNGHQSHWPGPPSASYADGRRSWLICRACCSTFSVRLITAADDKTLIFARPHPYA